MANGWIIKNERLELGNEYGTLRLTGEQAYRITQFGQEWAAKRKDSLDKLADEGYNDYTPHHGEVLTCNYAVKDWDLLERHYKHNGYSRGNAEDFELGWEAAIRYYTSIELRQSKIGTALMHAATTAEGGDVHATAREALHNHWNSLRADPEMGPAQCIDGVLQFIFDGNVPGIGYVQYFGNKIVYDDTTWYRAVEPKDHTYSQEVERLTKENEHLVRKLQERDTQLAQFKTQTDSLKLELASLRSDLKQANYEKGSLLSVLQQKNSRLMIAEGYLVQAEGALQLAKAGALAKPIREFLDSALLENTQGAV